MTIGLRNGLLTLALVAAPFACFSADTQPLRYNMSILVPLADPPATGPFPPLCYPLYGSAAALNNSGVVVGETFDLRKPRARATIWGESRTPSSVGDLSQFGEFAGSSAVAINDNGTVVLNVSYEGFVVVERGVSTAYLGASANTLNSAGVIGGYSHATRQAAIWTGAVQRDLPSLGGTSSQVASLNSAGTAVGSSSLIGDPTYQCMPWEGGAPCVVAHATAWTPDGNILDLGTLGGAASWATSINELGQVIGAIRYERSQVAHAFVWENGLMTDLGAGTALDMNNVGVVVGSMPAEYGNPLATIWIDGRATNLNSLLASPALADDWHIYSAAAVNDAGQIAASAYSKLDGRYVAVLLTPVDEPPIMLLMAFGLTGHVWLARRKKDAVRAH